MPAKDLKITLYHQANQQVTNYFTGSTVSGKLSVYLEEGDVYSIIQVTLHGASHVEWTEGRGEGRTVHFESNTTYVQQFVVLWSSQQSPTGEIAPGWYEYPFQFTIPSNCPSSFNGDVGYIRYYIQGLVGAGSMSYHVELPIQVSQIVDINQASLLKPVRLSLTKQVGTSCCKSGVIELTAEIPRTGYCVKGDTIPINVTVKNDSSRIIRIRAAVFKEVQYYATATNTLAIGTPESKSNRSYNAITPFSNSQPIQPRTSTVVQLLLTVPATSTNIYYSSDIVIYHTLEVSVVIPRSTNLSGMFPIVLGNMPLRESQEPAQTQPTLQPAVQLPTQVQPTVAMTSQPVVPPSQSPPSALPPVISVARPPYSFQSQDPNRLHRSEACAIL